MYVQIDYIINTDSGLMLSRVLSANIIQKTEFTCTSIVNVRFMNECSSRGDSEEITRVCFDP